MLTQWTGVTNFTYLLADAREEVERTLEVLVRPADMRRQAKLVIEHHWDYGKFIRAVADQVPPNDDMNLVLLVGDLCARLCR